MIFSGMIHFEWPWVFFLIPLPWLLRKLLSPAELARDAALRVPFLDDFKSLTGKAVVEKTSQMKLWLATIAWLLVSHSCCQTTMDWRSGRDPDQWS